MFDILVGTLLPSHAAIPVIKQLNPKGFECYEIYFDDEENIANIAEYSKEVMDAVEGRKISAIAVYGNTMNDKAVYNRVETLIKNAHLFGCNTVCLSAGADPTKNVPDNIPLFKKTFEPLAKLAEEHGVKIGFENCGYGWHGNSDNIAFCPSAWELMFDAVPSDALGLEWEPAHQLCALVDPIPQLRKWAKKVVHVHGKDATVAWDVVREYGTHGIVPYAWHRTPGFGDSNWSDIFTILLQAGFKGSVDIEGYHDPVHYDDMEWTAQITSLEYLKRARGGVEFFEGPVEYRGYQGKRK
ncbi:MAG: sugar phosphate isomerase/epimerase [Ruminococcaceae bacterium]|nr:sugar phosphate isomerase/epimerase [Oscillospiraceae bacterium]